VSNSIDADTAGEEKVEKRRADSGRGEGMQPTFLRFEKGNKKREGCDDHKHLGRRRDRRNNDAVEIEMIHVYGH